VERQYEPNCVIGLCGEFTGGGHHLAPAAAVAVTAAAAVLAATLGL
jgi:hypothetical protein